jgi:hypothetical protein
MLLIGSSPRPMPAPSSIAGRHLLCRLRGHLLMRLLGVADEAVDGLEQGSKVEVSMLHPRLAGAIDVGGNARLGSPRWA